MQFLVIRSIFSDQQVLGQLFIIDGAKTLFQCKTLELDWEENKQNISCVPAGIYDIVLEMSPKYGMAWELKGVPNRSEVKIHNANYYRQIRGCIAIGDMHTKIDSDDYPDVRNSKPTRLRMERVMSDANITKTKITIIDMADINS